MYIYQYYVVADQDYLNSYYEGEIYYILAGPFHSGDDAEKWISSNPHALAAPRLGEPTDLLVVRAKVEVSLC